MTHALSSDLIRELKSLFPADRLTFEADDRNEYGRDWTKQFPLNAAGVFFVHSAEELAALVRWARRHKIALVPSGGRTGLSGGACAINGELVVSFERMNKISDLNPVDRTVRVQAGVVTETLQKYALDNGFYYPVDFAARGSSHIGGNIATNAGGVKVLRYGLTRDWIASLRVVTGHGEILELNQSLVKNATGYDLRHLWIGSEGTLGFITDATIRLANPPQELKALILAVPDLQAIMSIFQMFRSKLPLTAFEFFSEKALTRVIEHAHLARPLTTVSPYYLLVEVEMTAPSVEETLLSVFESCVESAWVTDGSISQSETQAREFWRLREDISEATAPFTPYKNDVSVTISKVPEFLKSTDDILTRHYPDFEVVWFGHIGDGNMHINILKPAALERNEFIERCQKVNEVLFDLIAKLGGSVSAEHGVGLLKKPYLKYTRSEHEIALMRGIKSVFDPDGIINPGKIF